MKSGAPVRQATGGLRNSAFTISHVKSMTTPLQGILAIALKDCLPMDPFVSSREVSNCSLNVHLLSGYLVLDQANVSVSCVFLKANMRFLNIAPFFQT